MYQFLAAIGHAFVPSAKLSEVDQMVIETMIENGFTSEEIGQRFGYELGQIEESVTFQSGADRPFDGESAAAALEGPGARRSIVTGLP